MLDTSDPSRLGRREFHNAEAMDLRGFLSAPSMAPKLGAHTRDQRIYFGLKVLWVYGVGVDRRWYVVIGT